MSAVMFVTFMIFISENNRCQTLTMPKGIKKEVSSVSDPLHFDLDLDPRIYYGYGFDRIRIQNTGGKFSYGMSIIVVVKTVFFRSILRSRLSI